ncbi:MAG: hypothetical protein CM1200mP30_17540 [Pseudomonadota bacterium]|nr:MAG: hypothetical protein CM1200mP30_17540 [Pseudomonadota bacterium]
MTKWIRFNFKQDTGLFGTLDGDSVDEYEGDLFKTPKNPTGRKIPINEVQVGAPRWNLIQFLLYGIIFMNVQKRKNRQSQMYRFTS